MSDNIKTFCLIVITICVFVIALIDILELVEKRNNGIDSVPQVNLLNHQRSITDNPNEAVEKTTINFTEMKHDFGELKQGDVVTHTFQFSNNGDKPLLITNAIGSCGCTVPTYPKDPIVPGGTGVIEVKFNSTGREGLQNKTVTVSANTNPSTTVLTITANVSK